LINDLFIVGCKCLLCSKKMLYTEKLEINYTSKPFFYIHIYSSPGPKFMDGLAIVHMAE